LEESDKAWNIAIEEEMPGQQRVVLFWKAYIYLEMNYMGRAKKATVIRVCPRALLS